MAGTRLVRERAPLNVRFSGDAISKAVSVEMPDVDLDDLRSLLSLFRQFLLKTDTVYFSRAVNEAIRYSTDDTLTGQLRTLRYAWNTSYANGGAIPIIVDDRTLTAEQACDLLMNAGVAHNEVDKIEALRQLDVPVPLVRLQVFMTLPTLTQIIFYAAELIERGLAHGLFDFGDPQGR